MTPLLTVKEAARLCGVSEITIRRRIKDGCLKAYKIGPRTVRISPDDLQKCQEGGGSDRLTSGTASPLPPRIAGHLVPEK